jgi:hypothetical protein
MSGFHLCDPVASVLETLGRCCKIRTGQSKLSRWW